MPEIVVYETNGKDAIGLDYSMITPLLIEAVKQLKTENSRLRKNNEELKAGYDQIIHRLEKLENLYSERFADE